MLIGISIGNFKAFSKTQRAPLKPITLVFGPNSSGKSSLVHALALAHETFKHGTIDINRIESAGGTIELGGFVKYVHKRNLDARSTLSFEFERRYSELGDSPYCVTLELGISAESQQQPTVLQYVAATNEGKIFELVHLNVNSKAALMLKDLNLQHSRVIEMVSHTFRDLAEVNHPDFEADTFIQGIVKYAASRIAFDTKLLLQGKNNEYRPSFGFNCPIQLYLLTAISMSSQCYGWLMELVSKVVAWEEKRPQRTDERRKKRAANPEFEEALRGLLESFDSIEDAKPPFYEFHPAISYVLADEDEQENLHMPSFDMDDAEAKAFYAAVDTDELQQVYDQSGRAFIKLLDRLRFMVTDVNDGLTEDFYPDLLPLFAYLGPVRNHPSQLVQRHEAAEVSRSELLWDYLAIGRMKQVNKWLGSGFLDTHYRIDKRELFTLRDADLKSLLESVKVSGDISAAAASVEPSATELILTDLRAETEVDFGAVGFGIGQVLPVLLSCFEMSETLIAIEQPEIHLHPALQAELGDVFIDSARSRKNRFVLETHSEHLILRLLRRIRETTSGELEDGRFALTSAEVSVLYVQPGENGAEISELRIDEEGEFIDRWPNGFFAERAKELF